MFFEIAPEALNGTTFIQRWLGGCLPHSNGAPRKSSYQAIYRVLERMPFAALSRLHLATHDGRTLSLTAEALPASGSHPFHLYQEFCPVTPRVVSILGPQEFCARLTDSDQAVSLPKIVFAELTLGSLAHDIESTDVGNLPYTGLAHLRDCLHELSRRPAKPTKVVVRNVRDDVLYRTILGGFYVGQGWELKYYPMPSLNALETIHHEWWRSALASFGG